MERLTERWCKGMVRIKGCSTAYPDKERKGAPAANAIVRLADYEDTGMTPKQVRLISNVLQEVGETYNCWFDYVVNCVLENSHLKELAQAEKDGRLVILPCKSDTVYTIEEDYFNCSECIHGSRACFKPEINRVSCDMDCGVHCPFYIKEHEVSGFEIGFDMTGNAVLSHPGEFGYEGLEQFAGIDSKVYYTREEADAALKKREADNEAD